MTAPAATAALPQRRSLSVRARRRKLVNWIMLGLIGLAVVITIAPLVAVLLYVLTRGIPGLKPSLFTSLPRPIDKGGGGAEQSFIGSIIIVGLASIIGTLVGLAGGVYLSEYGHGRLASVIRFFADVLAGIPSIVVGLFVYVLLVAPLHGFSALAGAVSLAILMLPLVVRTTEEIMKLVPGSLREAGLALGLPRWLVVLRVLLPAAASGIITGLLLAIARIAGETAPLLFTAFGNEFFQGSLFKPMDALPLRIFKYATGPYPVYHAIAQASAVVLILFVLVLSLGARYFFRGVEQSR